MIGIKHAGRPAALLCLGIVALSLTIASGAAGAAKPTLPTPTCAITGVTYAAASGRLVGKGKCSYRVRQASGKLKKVTPLGRKWSFAGLKVYDSSGAACTVVKSSGLGNTVTVQPRGAYKLSVTFRLRVAKNRSHAASNVASKTVTRVLGGKTAVCSAPPVVAPEGANSPTGSNNGSDTENPGNRGFNCGWIGGVTVDASGVHVPKVDCSGNGTCQWVREGSPIQWHGMTLPNEDIKCSNGALATPDFKLHVAYSDGTSCDFFAGQTSVLTITAQQLSGTLTGSIALQTFGTTGMPLTLTWPTVQFGPIVGTGTTRLC
jgi:hypothetical protein